VRFVYFMPHVHCSLSVVLVSGMVSVLLLRIGSVAPSWLRSKPMLKDAHSVSFMSGEFWWIESEVSLNARSMRKVDAIRTSRVWFSVL